MIEDILNPITGYEETTEGIETSRQASVRPEGKERTVRAKRLEATVLDTADAWEREPSVENIRALQQAVRRWQNG